MNNQITRLYLYSLHGDYSQAPIMKFDSGLLVPSNRPRRPRATAAAICRLQRARFTVRCPAY